jgi:hypothetical protein
VWGGVDTKSVSTLGNRWEQSVSTFGPFGRVTATLALLAPPVSLLWTAGPFGIFGAVIWCGWVLRPGLSDVWRRAPLPETDLTRLAAEAAREAREAEREPRTHRAFDGDPPPARW